MCQIRKKFNLLSERLASLGKMGDQLRAPFKSRNTLMLWWYEGFQRAFNHPPWCRYTLFCRSTMRLIAVFFPVWWHCSNGNLLNQSRANILLYFLRWMFVLWRFLSFNVLLLLICWYIDLFGISNKWNTYNVNLAW